MEYFSQIKKGSVNSDISNYLANYHNDKENVSSLNSVNFNTHNNEYIIQNRLERDKMLELLFELLNKELELRGASLEQYLKWLVRKSKRITSYVGTKKYYKTKNDNKSKGHKIEGTKFYYYLRNSELNWKDSMIFTKHINKYLENKKIKDDISIKINQIIFD